MPLASVFTPSYNKAAYAAEAIGSVLAQDFGDFEYWVLENSTDRQTRQIIAPLVADPRVIYEEIELSPAERMGSYPPAVLLNRYYPKASGKYIFYLSDDDLLEPSCLSRAVEFLEADEARRVCYWSLWITTLRRGVFVPDGVFTADRPMGAGTLDPSVDCKIDGGQIAHRTDCLDGLGQPWFPESPVPTVANHCDGLFMNKLARRHTFHPLPGFLSTKRRTPASTFDKPQ